MPLSNNLPNMPPRLPSSRNPNLTLQHFIALSSLFSSYRSLIRSTRVLPTLASRRESIAFYKPDFYFRPSLPPPADGRTPMPSRESVDAHLGKVGRAVNSVPWASWGGNACDWQTLGRGEVRQGPPRVVKKSKRQAKPGVS